MHIYSKFREVYVLSFSSIVIRHFGPCRLIAQTTKLLANAIIPRIVKIQPFPMALINGAATILPTHEKIFLIKLLTATPDDDFCGINSVSIVVTIVKMSKDPTPNKKLPII